MPATDPLHELTLLIRSRHGLAVIDSAEEDRVEGLLRHLADALDLPLFLWTRTRGLRRDDADGPVYGTQQPVAALAHVQQAAVPAVHYFPGLLDLLEDQAVADALLEAVQVHESTDGIVVLSGGVGLLPERLRPRSATVRLAPPGDEDYHQLVGRIVRDVRQRQRVDVTLSPADLQQLYANLRGLTLLEAEKLLTRAVVEDGRLDAGDIDAVLKHKRRIVEREGVLEYYPAEDAFTAVAGLSSLKEWLARRRSIIAEPARAREFGLEFPKGVLLVGVPGSGKSLCAKAVATEWRLPLLKMDPARLYNRYVGETERNFERAMRTAERMAPCVLWIDEIEKAFAEGGSGDGGLSTRVLGTFLSWLQDRRGDVFVVATANAVERLPPELMRKGRFDEIFFVDLPDTAARRQIFALHLERRNQAPTAFDLDRLAAATDGFSGAEIEQVVVSALYTAFAGGGALDDAALLSEVEATSPLSVVAGERIAGLRAWAAGRAVPAD